MTTSVSSPQRRARSIRLAEVTDVERLGPRVVRVILGGPGLAGFDATEFTDQYVKLLIPPLGATYGPPFNVEEIRAQLPSNQWPRTRTYTAHSWDAERQRLSIDFVIHGQTGVAGPWAAAAQPGDMIQFDGPGGSYAPDPRAGWHLMVGDFSVLPAISASLSRVPSDVPAYVFVELDAFEKKRELHTPEWADLPPRSAS
jgi:NADPH-dependent ferric siderophore reductase